MAALDSSAVMPVQAGRQRTGPLGVRLELQVRRARSLHRRRPCNAPPDRDLGQAVPEAGIAGIDRPLAPGLGILDHEQADVRQAELARVDDLNGDDLAATPEARQRRAPGADLGNEVRHHDREPTSSQDVAEAVDRAPEVDLPPER